MTSKYNSMTFTSEDMKKELHFKLMTTLVEIAEESDNKAFEISIKPEDDYLVIEWRECDPIDLEEVEKNAKDVEAKKAENKKLLLENNE